MCERPVNGPRLRPEIVAPAGSADTMRAAIGAGADAVYFGLRGFNARGGAENVDVDGLGGAMRLLHEGYVRGYVALNTLVFDEELGAVEAAVRACAAAGVDAVVVQDLGVASLVRAVAPDMPIHASTQMTCTDARAMRIAAQMGIKRVILPRELSFADIAAVRAETDIELEVFVHGALCISYSGQCFASVALGGRSGNRGECAQPCRLPYRLVVDGEIRDLGERAYLLSPEDLEATAYVSRLAELGVAALKIEGRMKAPEYVAATARLYRKALLVASGEAGGSIDDDLALALQMFSRGSGPGFLAGVDHRRLVEGRGSDHRGTRVGVCRGRTDVGGKTYLNVAVEAPVVRGDGLLVEGGFAGDGEVGGRVWGLVVRGQESEHASKGDDALVWLGPDKQIQRSPEGRRVFRTDDPRRKKRLCAEIGRREHRVPIDVRVSGALGERPSFEARTDGGTTVRVQGDCALEEARNAPLCEQTVREKLARLGATPFELRSLRLAWPENAIVPVSSLNRARRGIVDALLSAFTRERCTSPTTHRVLLSSFEAPALAPLPAGLFVLCRMPAQAVAALEAGADGVYLDFADLAEAGHVVRTLREKYDVAIGLAPPRIRKPGEEKIDRYLESLQPDAMLVRSIGALGEGASRAAKIGDFSLNVNNSLSAAMVLSRGLRAFTPAIELGAATLMSFLKTPIVRYAEVVVYQRMPLFHTQHCVLAALLSNGQSCEACGRPCERHEVSLRDRKGRDLPVWVDASGRNTVFEAAPRTMTGALGDLGALGVRRFRIELVFEVPDDVRKIVGSCRGLVDALHDGETKAGH